MKLPRLTGRWGPRLLGVWLIALAVLELVPSLHFSHSAVLLALLAGAAGVLLLLDR